MKIQVLVYKSDMHDEIKEIEIESGSNPKGIVIYVISRLYTEEEINGIDFTLDGKYQFYSAHQIFHGVNQ